VFFTTTASPKRGFIDTATDDRCVPASMFERQLAAIAEFAEIIPLDTVPDRLTQNSRARRKPLVCLTFDNGYANFLTNALLVLEPYDAPAMLSVVSGLTGTRKPAPLDIREL
jgi:peptidoglycan/xylan/chitin deacetylase (PgdA/CDA1 family)